MINMDVGTVDETGTTFDIDILEETDSLLLKNATKIRWMYKDEKGQLVVLEKDRRPVGKGSLIEATAGSVGRLVESPVVTTKSLAKMLKPYSRESQPRETIVGTDVLVAYLQRVKLI